MKLTIQIPDELAEQLAGQTRGKPLEPHIVKLLQRWAGTGTAKHLVLDEDDVRRLEEFLDTPLTNPSRLVDRVHALVLLKLGPLSVALPPGVQTRLAAAAQRQKKEPGDLLADLFRRFLQTV